MVGSGTLSGLKGALVDLKLFFSRGGKKLKNKITDELKQVIVIRKDLNLSAGKSAAQASHASVSCFQKVRKKHPELADRWLAGGQKKVVLGCADEAELKRLEKEAKNTGLTTCLVSDAGRTELKPGTITALAIGPASEKNIDKITGNLNLY